MNTYYSDIFKNRINCDCCAHGVCEHLHNINKAFIPILNLPGGESEIISEVEKFIESHCCYRGWLCSWSEKIKSQQENNEKPSVDRLFDLYKYGSKNGGPPFNMGMALGLIH